MISNKTKIKIGIRILLVVLLLSIISSIAFADSTNETNTTNTTNTTENITSEDFDNDGFISDEDCDDYNPDINPDAVEICNCIDDNCNLLVDEGFDFDGDFFFPEECSCYEIIDCDDSNDAINPNATELVGNSIDDDCNPSTLDTLSFAIATDQNDYYLAETGSYTVLAPQDATVYITITTPNTDHNSLIILDGPFPKTQLIPYMRRAGSYTIDAVLEYQNHTYTESTFFVVWNTLTASITSDQVVSKSENFAVSATASGGLGTLSYSWAFGDSGTAEGSSAIHSYSASGIYLINLTVTDSEQNSIQISKPIEVATPYAVTIIVKSGSSNLEDATVKIDVTEKETDSAGKAVFPAIREGVRQLKITKSGYESLNEEISVTGSFTKTVDLEEKDAAAPQITLVSPADNTVFEENNVNLKFKAIDSSQFDCELYLSFDCNWWNKEKGLINVASNTETSFEVLNLSAATYCWKVRCVDSESNAGFSDKRSFTIKSAAEATLQDSSQQDDAGDDFVSQAADTTLTQDSEEEAATEIYNIIEESLSTLDHLGLKEKEAARLLDLESQLIKIKKNIQNLNRDIFNLRYRRVNESEREALRIDMEAQLEAEKDKIITSLEVLDSTSYVKYLSKQDLEETISQVILAKNISLSEEKIKEALLELHKSVTVSSSAFVIKMEYLDQDSKIFTIIQKEIKIGNMSGIDSMLEIIPKDIVDSAGDLIINGEYEVLIDDPVIEFSANESFSIQYMIEKQIKVKDIERTQSVVVPLIFISKSTNKITGFAISDMMSSAASSSTALLILASLVILITGTAYFWEDVMELIPLDSSSREQINNAKQLIFKANSNLDDTDIENAKSLYSDLIGVYGQLNDASRLKIKPDILELYNRINHSDIQLMLRLAEHSIMMNDKQRALSLYSQVMGAYKSLHILHKRTVIQRCIRLHQKINMAR